MPSVRHIGYFPKENLDPDLNKLCWDGADLEEYDPLFKPVIKLTLIQAMTLFWRIKSFSFTTNLNENVTTTNIRLNNYTLNAFDIGEIGAADEQSLILANDRLWHLHPMPETISNTRCEIRFDRAWSPLTPAIICSAQNFESENEDAWYAVTSNPDEPELTPGVGYVEIDIPEQPILDPNGNNVRFGLFGFVGTAIGVDQARGYLRAHEWWEYDPGDGGGPIYDKVTGRQLRPFP